MSGPMPGVDTVLRHKLLWLMGLRVAAVTILLGSGVLVQTNAPGAFAVNPFFFVIGLTYALTVGYALTLRYVERHRWLVDFQLGADAVIVSSVVFITGGIVSYFSTLYVLPIVGASVVQSRRGGLLVGVLGSVMYCGVVSSQYAGAFGLLGGSIAGPFALALPPVRTALYSVSLNLIGFIGVALLSGYLAEGLRRADVRLQLASTELADLQAFNQHVIDSMTSGLATTDSDWRILTFNRAAEAITGHSAAAVKGRFIHDVFRLPEGLSRSLTEGPTDGIRHDFAFSTGDGRRVELGLGASPLITPSGREGYLFAFRDVTESRKLARERRIQQRLAAVGEMAAGIAHEIRNPLASMSGSIQILREDLPLDEEQTKLMDIVLKESDRLNHTIKSFLAYARPQRFATEHLDVRRVVDDTALLLCNSVECRESHEVDVAVPSHEVPYEADEGQLKQILWNLATNGLRAMPDGGRLGMSVDIAKDGLEGTVVIDVEDEGVGMTQDDADGMFQPFHGNFTKGSGLGLAIVHRIVSDHEGEIKVSSTPGSGTRVRVLLPPRRLRDESIEPAPSDVTEAPDLVSGQGL